MDVSQRSIAEVALAERSANSADQANKQVRPTRDEYFCELVRVIAKRATCARRRVGCILVNSRGHILSTGYNGVAAGLAHCLDSPCAGATAVSGTDLAACDAIHAEQNALLQCKDVYEIATAYCTASPCELCVKMLMNTSCNSIVFLEEYPHPHARELWLKKRLRQWYNFTTRDIQFGS